MSYPSPPTLKKKKETLVKNNPALGEIWTNQRLDGFDPVEELSLTQYSGKFNLTQLLLKILYLFIKMNPK